jgi:hypothetical protein
MADAGAASVKIRGSFYKTSLMALPFQRALL